MPVTITWDDEHCTILRVDYTGRWTMAEVRAAFDDMNRLVAGLALTPILLLNHVNGYVPPQYGFELVASDSLPLSPYGLPEAVVFVGNPLVYELYDALRRPLPVQGQLHMVWTSTLSEARETIARLRAGGSLQNQFAQPVAAN
jgi:hypothetical protein